MPLPHLVKQLVEIKFTKYCERKVPPQFRDKVRLKFTFRGNSVTLFEERPSFRDRSRWLKNNVAQFRYDHELKEWTLYCRDQKARWHVYDDVEPTKDIEPLLKEVDRHPIFYG